MWFFRNKPSNLDIKWLVSSYGAGYQLNTVVFKVSVVDQKGITIAIPYPWTPHKTDGSLTIDSNTESQLTFNCERLNRNNVKIVNRFKELNNAGYELFMIQELSNWYLDDIAVMLIDIEPEKYYTITYSHKISADSYLFIPTRLSCLLSTIPVQFKLWILNGITADLPKQLKRIGVEPINNTTAEVFDFNTWGWEDDTRIISDNWESSDDEKDSDSEDE
jgi:hypothetical protein